MRSSATDSYLETQVLTATPQKLQLMLVDAAIRSIERAKQHMEAQAYEQACDALIHAQRVITEILAGLNHDDDPALTKKVAAVYMFVFRRLLEANGQRDTSKLDDALRVLHVERGTWQTLCDTLGSSATAGEFVPTSERSPAASPAAGRPEPRPAMPPLDLPALDAEPSSGFSWEA
jgi:flagellar biosynthetic protein FliS